MYKVDLNSDLGESFGAYTIGSDDRVPQASHVTLTDGDRSGGGPARQARLPAT